MAEISALINELKVHIPEDAFGEYGFWLLIHTNKFFEEKSFLMISGLLFIDNILHCLSPMPVFFTNLVD